MNPNKIVEVLAEFSQRSGISLEILLSLYLVLGESIMLVLHLFQGHSVTFPSMKTLHSVYQTNKRLLLKEDDRVMLDNGTLLDANEVSKGMIITHADSIFLVRKIHESGLGFRLLFLEKME